MDYEGQQKLTDGIYQKMVNATLKIGDPILDVVIPFRDCDDCLKYLEMLKNYERECEASPPSFIVKGRRSFLCDISSCV